MSENSREIKLARRALRTAWTHLAQARGLVSMDQRTYDLIQWDMERLTDLIIATQRREMDADAHLAEQVAKRKRSR